MVPTTGELPEAGPQSPAATEGFSEEGGGPGDVEARPGSSDVSSVANTDVVSSGDW